MAPEEKTRMIAPWARVSILVVTLVTGCALSYTLTGTVVPTAPADVLIFQSTLLFVVLGSAVLEHKFTRPADSVVNALMGMIALVTVYGIAPKMGWWVVFSYCFCVFVVSLTCSIVSTEPKITGWRRTVADLSYRPAVVFGRARLLYSVVFLFAVFTFYGVQTRQTAILVLFWGLFMAVWPLGIPEILSGIRPGRSLLQPIGRVARLDSPNLLRITLNLNECWDSTCAVVYQAPDGTQHRVLPLYVLSMDDQTLATGLCVVPTSDPIPGLSPGSIYRDERLSPLSESDVAQQLGGGVNSTLIGFVIEDSHIGAIRFETLRHDRCREGLLVWCHIGQEKVFYQVTEGVTREESLETERHGFQCGVAAQLGVLDPNAGFAKYPWLPLMNTPVFCESKDFGSDAGTVHEGDFIYGRVPGTQIQIGGPFSEYMDYHTAILGVTGSGKTELAFDLIRHVLTKKVKVVCIDLTARYEDRLKDLNHKNLSISGELSTKLSEKLFEAETGAYGAGKEKQALQKFNDELRKEVSARVKEFLTHANHQLGVITLDEISNTKATLAITELYLTCLLHFARDNADTCPRVLIVVEEAHTVMPEPTTMGTDYDSRGVVGKIAQIALQGRKYGVGLLVIAQRTATVSKTVLTQCNTMITLNCFDETSLGFLAKVYGEAHTQLIANLPRLNAVIFGRGVRSERPIVVEIPYDDKKATAEHVAAVAKSPV
jgi:hypothetical protein